MRALKDRIAAADGLLLVTPEYNNSVPGVFKNAIDWLSRPPADIPRVFGNRPVAVMRGHARPRRHEPRAGRLAAGPAHPRHAPWFGRVLSVSSASKVFDEAGAIVDEKVRERAREFIAGFAEFAGGEITAAMKAILFDKPGDETVLRLGEAPRPPAARASCASRVHARA